MPHASASSAIPLRVLLVDDNAWLRRGIRGALERAGLIVIGEAANGGQALAQAAAERPDVVLMDLRMPGMDGIETTRALRHQQPELRVVLWTGEDDAQLASAIRKSGAHAGLPKGVPTIELIATLQGACPARPVSTSW